MEIFTRYLAVAIGGMAGAMLRYYIGLSALSRTAAPFPTATFFINVTGSFIIGFFLTLATERIPFNPHLRLAVAVGFVGAYTTFSAFEYETARLVEERDFLYAFLNVVLSFVIGFAAVWGGILAARRVESAPLIGRAFYTPFETEAEISGPAQTESAERNIRDATIENSPDAKDKEANRIPPNGSKER